MNSSFSLKSKIKLLLLLVATFLGISSLYFSQMIIQKIQEKETEIANLYAKSLTYLANSEGIAGDFSFIFENIVQKIDFPLIITDTNEVPIVETTGTGFRNIEFDSTYTHDQLLTFLNNKVKEFSKQNEPILVYYPHDVVWRKIYYGSSDVILLLYYFPYAQIAFAIIFLTIAYFTFNYFRKSEESNIWVGLSKETAHQLGTPISSLLGWNELIKLNYENPVKVIDISDEITNDLNRLNRIANRFSKIGSKPELKKINLLEKLEEIKRYFERRFPQSGMQISILVDCDKSIITNVNPDLFEWVIENLIKNARDAIESKNGVIRIKVLENLKNIVIDVSDNGKGIDSKSKKKVFNPGYSTKVRGWGLGLSLSRRIIDEYHKGKLFLKETSNLGSTFTIVLPINIF